MIRENMAESIADQIKKAVFEAVKRVCPEVALKPEDIALEHPAAEEHGDYSSNIALKIKGKMSNIKSSEQIAKTIVAQLNQLHQASPDEANGNGVETASAGLHPVSEHKNNLLWECVEAKQGFINFRLSQVWQVKQVEQVLQEGEKYGESGLLKGKKIMVEFAHPNTHKMFHIGHLRNISLGESLIRLLESQGAKVIRANYQGDVGLHIAKAIYGILQVPKEEFEKLKTLDERIKFLGRTYAAGAMAYEQDEKAQETIKDINYLVYASAQRFQQERGINPGSTDYLKFVEGRAVDVEKVYQLWKETRQWSLDYFDTVYKRVYTHYDRFYFESECLAGVDLAKDAVKKGVLRKNDGAIIFDGKPYGLDTRVFVNSLGLPTYEGKELALSNIQFREHGHLDKLIHVLGPEQVSFTQVTFKVEELLGIQNGQQFHFAYGWVRLKEGKMSSRTGKVVLGEWLLDEIKAKLEEKYPDRLSDTEAIAVAAAKYSLLKVGPFQEIAFDINESISLEGDSGPYLQYTYARAKSVLRKSKVKSQKLKVDSNLTIQQFSNEELSVLRSLYRFPEVVELAARTYSPNLLCSYLFELAKRFNNLYNNCPILENPFRLTLTASVATVVKNGLSLLGMEALERM